MRYFAYGSNMCSARLRRRTPSARARGVARLTAHVLRFHKRGRDGSSKCDAYYTGGQGDIVIGVIYDIDDTERPDLDRAEDLGEGYRRDCLTVQTEDGAAEAWVYRALPGMIDPSLPPFTWYVRYVLAGASEHAFPSDYVEAIERVAAVADPDEARAALHRRTM